MCSLNKCLLAVCCLLSVSNAQNNVNEAIGFPEVEENTAIKNKDNRQPVYMPSACSVNELYYPGDQKDDWICDCRPAFLYHPDTDMCWPAYRQGPCQAGQYLILPSNSVIPICEKNPCDVDSYVMFNGKCEQMHGSASCISDLARYAPMVLGVNATTIEIACVPLNLESRFSNTVTVATTSGCAIGSRRNVGNKCVPVV